jgi:hypothetical protein
VVDSRLMLLSNKSENDNPGDYNSLNVMLRKMDMITSNHTFRGYDKSITNGDISRSS